MPHPSRFEEPVTASGNIICGAILVSRRRDGSAQDGGEIRAILRILEE